MERQRLKIENTNHFFIEKIIPANKRDNIVLFHKRSVLINADVLEDKLFENESFDLIVTSPPYNVDIKYNSHKDNLTYAEYLDFSEQWLKNCYNWTKKQGRLCLNIPLDKNKGGQKSVGADLTVLAQKIDWKYHSTIIWNEGNISRRTAWGSWLSASAPYVIAPVELIVVFYKDEGKKTNGQTEVIVTFDPETENSIEFQRNGWQAILDNFQKYIGTN